MFGRTFRVATIAGVPVHVDSSWLWIAAFITYSLWLRFQAVAGGAVRGLAFAVVTASLFFGAVLLHELAHALAARAQRIPVFGITLVIFGGFTSARSDARGPGPAFVIAAVGPATSLALGGLFWGLSRVLEASNPALAVAFGSVGWVNLFMAAFNVLPGLPLDGGRMLQAAVWRFSGRSDLGTRVAARGGTAVAALLVAGAILEVTRQDLVAALWLAIIGSFIYRGSRDAERSARAAARLATGRVADVLAPPPQVVPADITLSEALDRFLRGHEGLAFPVADGGRIVGLVSFSSAREIGVEDPLRPVRDALIPLDEVVVLHPDDPLDAVTPRLVDGRLALVLRDGELVGTVSGERVLAWASAPRG
ncbi:MAG: site-2 protease family protein [Actinomycetota bacterium]